MSITYTGGGTATHLALDSAQSDSFTSSRGVRTTAARVAVVLTDGKSNNERLTALEAQRLRDKVSGERFHARTVKWINPLTRFDFGQSLLINKRLKIDGR